MFAISMREVPRVAHYASAVELYDLCVERGKPKLCGFSLLGKERSEMCVHKDEKGNIRFRYHATDVVTWKPDNTCQLDLGYESLSTKIFAENFTPRHVGIFKQGSIVHVRGGFCGTQGHVIVNAEGDLVETDAFIRTRSVNRKKARALLEREGAPAYLAWRKTMAPLMGQQAGSVSNYDFEDPATWLKDKEKWHGALLCHQGLPEAVRWNLYYRNHEVFDFEDKLTVPHYPSGGRFAVVGR